MKVGIIVAVKKNVKMDAKIKSLPELATNGQTKALIAKGR
jgi:hypothetical protein